MSELLGIYLLLCGFLAFLTAFFIVVNVFELSDGGNETFVRESKRNVRMSVYAFLATPLWPAALVCLVCYGLYKLFGGVTAAFR